MPFKNYREESKKKWGKELPEEDKLTLEQLNTGCLLRMADATEAMAKNHQQLINDRDWYERQYKYHLDKSKRLERSHASLRGVITKMKNKSKIPVQEAVII